ncbi:MAG: PIN domain-containing protein [Dermatophilaceae bacterium]
MTVLDAYAVIGYLRDERCAKQVQGVLESATVISAANAAEVLDQLVRVFGRDADDVHADLALLADAGMQIKPVTADEGLLAGRLRARHYHGERCAVSLGDCLAAAAALTATLALANLGFRPRGSHAGRRRIRPPAPEQQRCQALTSHHHPGRRRSSSSDHAAPMTHPPGHCAGLYLDNPADGR